MPWRYLRMEEHFELVKANFIRCEECNENFFFDFLRHPRYVRACLPVLISPSASGHARSMALTTTVLCMYGCDLNELQVLCDTL